MKKTSIIRLTFLFVLNGLLVNGYAQTPSITISKKTSDDPDNVCNGSTSEYKATVSNVSVSYGVTWNPTNGTVEEGTGTITGVKIKWNASSSSDGYKGKLRAVLTVGSTNYNSNDIEVTIKSIKDQTATLAVCPPSPWNLSACETGSVNLEAGNMWVPGTGTVFPEQVNSFAWQVPSGWTVNGQPSIGTNWIITSQNVTVIYPQSNTGGSIKVKASYLVNCGGLQESKESTVVTVNRIVNFAISADKSTVLCGDISPVTFSVSPALPCALYYWNNSQTATTSNSFQITPDGHSNITATVNIVYGTSNTNLTKTLLYQLFPNGVTPKIVGSAVLCTGNYDYYVSDLRPGYFVSWTLDPKIQRVNEVDNVITVKSTSSGYATLSATITTTNCGTYSPDPSKTVWIGSPSFSTYVNGPSQLTPGLSAVYSIAPATGNPTYSWQIPSGCYSTYCWHITSGQGTTAIAVQAGAIGSGAVQVTASNGCPGNDSRYMYVTVLDPNAPCDPLTLNITPNPSLGGDVVIDVIKPPCDPTLMSSTPATLSVIDNMGTVVYSKKHSGNKIELKGLKLTKGLYHVVYIKDNKKVEKSMIVE